MVLQAQARCHRIGQSKAVKVYRLITRNSYEREMFDKASLKLGLDKAVLQSMSGRENNINGVSSPIIDWVSARDDQNWVFFFVVVVILFVFVVICCDLYLKWGNSKLRYHSRKCCNRFNSSQKRRWRTFWGKELTEPSWRRRMKAQNSVKRTLTTFCYAVRRPLLSRLKERDPPLRRQVCQSVFLQCVTVTD